MDTTIPENRAGLRYSESSPAMLLLPSWYVPSLANNNTTKPVESKRKICALRIPWRHGPETLISIGECPSCANPSFSWVLRPLRQEKITPGVISLQAVCWQEVKPCFWNTGKGLGENYPWGNFAASRLLARG